MADFRVKFTQIIQFVALKSPKIVSMSQEYDILIISLDCLAQNHKCSL